MDEATQKQLIEAAVNARQHAYAPYSKFKVGAAVLAEDGTIISGTNVENASYGLTLCAERIAAGSAASAGHRKLLAVAVTTTGGASPCGACRQFLAEFGGEMDVLLVDADKPDRIVTTTLDQLLPAQFKLKL